MPRAARATPPEGLAPPRDDYVWLSTRPLHVLTFLLPILALYELGSGLYLATGDAPETIRAHHLLIRVFDLFGAGGFYLPGALLVVVLLVWQVISRDSWRVRPRVLGGMLIESIAWVVVLLAFTRVLTAVLGLGAQAPPAASAPAMDSIAALPWQARATIAVGAGLYEELLFRLVGITLLHMILADLLGAPRRWAAAAAIVISALTFALYHDHVRTAAGTLDWPLLAYFTAAGIAFGIVYAWRGFGIVVAMHAGFDLVLLGVR